MTGTGAGAELAPSVRHPDARPRDGTLAVSVRCKTSSRHSSTLAHISCSFVAVSHHAVVYVPWRKGTTGFEEPPSGSLGRLQPPALAQVHRKSKAPRAPSMAGELRILRDGHRNTLYVLPLLSCPSSVVIVVQSMDDQCPVCKSDRYLNPKLRLLVSACYHKMCPSLSMSRTSYSSQAAGANRVLTVSSPLALHLVQYATRSSASSHSRLRRLRISQSRRRSQYDEG